MEYAYVTMFYTLEMIEDGKLADMLDSGWEIVAMAPFRMNSVDGETLVMEYLVTMRQPAE